MTQNPQLQIGLTGHFSLDIYNPETGEHRQYEFDNIITNGGLDRLGSAQGTSTAATMVVGYVQVGTGSTAPAVTDSALATYLAGTDRYFTSSASYGGAPDYYTAVQFSWQFNQGVAAGNLSEIGVGWASSGSLFSRALILDGGGNPTTITVTAIEFLTVNYTLRMYPPLTDATGTISLDGSDYDYIVRACGVNGGNWGSHGVSGYASYQGSLNAWAYTGDITTVTGATPAGSSSALGSGTPTRAAYSAGTYKLSMTCSASIGVWNLAGGIRSITFDMSGWLNPPGAYQMRWQCQFNPKIPKDNTKTLSLTFDVAWARKP